LNISDENALRIFERKFIKKLCGPACKDGVWRVKFKLEINSLLQGEDRMRQQNPLGLVGWAMWNVWRVRGPRNVYLTVNSLESLEGEDLRRGGSKM
jgi:hypothetical protein